MSPLDKYSLGSSGRYDTDNGDNNIIIYLENNRIFYYFGIFNFTTIRTIYVGAKEENFLEK